MNTRLFATALFLMIGAERMSAQFIKLRTNADTTVHAEVTAEGYVDAYYAFDFMQPSDDERPYFVSYSRHNEINVNLAYLSLRYNSDRVRAVFTPGFGTYMNANYAAERITLRNIVEANIGFRPFKKRDIWLDMGVIGSPYTNETAISLDQLVYTRSFASEYVPYYLSGARLTLPLGSKWTAMLYLLNGWQQIEDLNAPLAFGSQLDYKLNDKVQLDWDVYVGNERSSSNPDFRMRYFADLYGAVHLSDRLTWGFCGYAGVQEKNDATKLKNHIWWQANTSMSYAFKNKTSVCGRVEYFSDPDKVMINPVTGAAHFNCYSAQLGYNILLTSTTQLRFEGRYFWSDHIIFNNEETGKNVSQDALLTVGLTSRF